MSKIEVFDYDIIEEYKIKVEDSEDEEIAKFSFNGKINFFIIDVLYAKRSFMGLVKKYYTKRELFYFAYGNLRRVVNGSTFNQLPDKSDKIDSFRIRQFVVENIDSDELDGIELYTPDYKELK